MTAPRPVLAAKAALGAAWAAVKSYGAHGVGAALRRVFSLSLASWGSPGYEKLARLAFRNPHASRGLRLIAQLMAAAPLYVERREGAAWAAADGDAFADVLELFERPNERTTRFPFFLLVVSAIHCGGEFWLEKAGPVTGANAGRARRLRLILPDEFEGFDRDGAGEVTGYRFRSRRGGGYTRSIEECLHVRFPDPLDDERGLPILVAAQALAQMEKAAAWNESLASGAGRVPGYWKPVGLGEGKQLSEEQVARAEAAFDRRTRERADKNLEMVLSGSFERVEGAVTPKEADWLKGDQHNLRKVAALLGLSPALLGDEKGGSLTDAGVDSEVRAAYLLTVLPLLRWLLSELGPFLLGAQARGHRLAVDTDQIEALQEDVNAVWKRYSDPQAPLTRRERRAALGYDPEPAPELAEAEAAAPALALNGAQVTSALAVINQVAVGQLPRETGVAAIVTFFNVTEAQADQLLGTVGRGFVPAAPAVPPAPTPPREPAPELDGDGDDAPPFRSLRRMTDEDFRGLLRLVA